MPDNSGLLLADGQFCKANILWVMNQHWVHPVLRSVANHEALMRRPQWKKLNQKQAICHKVASSLRCDLLPFGQSNSWDSDDNSDKHTAAFNTDYSGDYWENLQTTFNSEKFTCKMHKSELLQTMQTSLLVKTAPTFL